MQDILEYLHLKFKSQLFLYLLVHLAFAQYSMSPDTLSLDGKIAIVTGSGRENGIGAAIAFALAGNGASVAINRRCWR